jgi:sigma-B regulation protein RsbU (phosphoserine phosphatase)
MGLFPYRSRPGLFSRRRWKRKPGPHVPTARSVLIIEALCGLLILALALTGRRGAYLDYLGSRVDALLVALVAVMVGVSHYIFVTRILPEMRRKASPADYDQQRILLDLSDASRHSNNIADVYNFSVNAISHALEVDSVSVLVADQATGNFILRSSSKPETPAGDEAVAKTHESPISLATASLAKDAFVVRRLSKLSSPLRIETDDLDAWQRAVGFIQGLDLTKRAVERESLRALDSRVLAQIRNKSQLTGILSIGPRRNGFDFTDKDLKMLMSIAEQIALVIDNSNLLERIVDQEKTLHEMALAASVQKHLFPSEVPETPTFSMSGYCKPAGFVGGDYYDLMQFENGRIGLAVADVAGKGFSAALLTFMIHAFLRSQALVANSGTALSPSLMQLATSLNRLLFASTSSASYVTLFYASYDQVSRRLNFINAGHNPPFVLHTGGAVAGSGSAGNGTVRKLDAGGPMLGLFQDCPVQEGSFQLEPGDFLFAYTDGAVEASNQQGEEFGEDRLLHLVKTKSHLPAARARDEILRSIEEWCEGAPQSDDITMVVLKINAQAA